MKHITRAAAPANLIAPIRDEARTASAKAPGSLEQHSRLNSALIPGLRASLAMRLWNAGFDLSESIEANIAQQRYIRAAGSCCALAALRAIGGAN